mmetsp:Transcript_27682/g.55893  ORF Transcript_27682/g.55893 Transcript_27682/m.55893 type:complete len:273 (+) Transcript_27682:526-1344(+)
MALPPHSPPPFRARPGPRRDVPRQLLPWPSANVAANHLVAPANALSLSPSRRRTRRRRTRPRPRPRPRRPPLRSRRPPKRPRHVSRGSFSHRMETVSRQYSAFRRQSKHHGRTPHGHRRSTTHPRSQATPRRSQNTKRGPKREGTGMRPFFHHLRFAFEAPRLEKIPTEIRTSSRMRGVFSILESEGYDGLFIGTTKQSQVDDHRDECVDIYQMRQRASHRHVEIRTVATGGGDTRTAISGVWLSVDGGLSSSQWNSGIDLQGNFENAKKHR